MAGKTYKALETFRFQTTKIVTIEKNQVIAEEFFKALPNPKYEIGVLITGKKIQELKEKESKKEGDVK